MTAPVPSPSLAPTRKWLAAMITALTGWVIALLQEGHFTTTLWIALATIVSQGLISWLVPNEATLGGVPLKSRRSQRGYALIELLVAVLVVLVLVLAILKLLAVL